MNVTELVWSKRVTIRLIAERHGALNVRVFGSFARGDAQPDSDVDLLVEPGPRTSLMKVLKRHAKTPGGVGAKLVRLPQRCRR